MPRSIVRGRGITELVHFTRYECLPSILDLGLLPRSLVEEREIPCEFNDEERHDLCEDASCLSISFPNYKMFWACRQEYGGNWVVLSLNPRILWQKECAFNPVNAASNEVRFMAREERQGREAFNAMFEDREDWPNRTETGIPDNFTTNPQAEVLVFDTIEPDNIQNIYFNNYLIMAEFTEEYGDIPHTLRSYYFDARQDYRDWRS